MLPSNRFLAGLLSFLAAHVCYLAALTSDSRLAVSFSSWPGWERR
jgi:uncharacterized membrane protein YhhN